MSCHTSCSKQHTPIFTPMLPRSGLIQDELGEIEDTMDLSERGGHFHINLKPQSHCH